MIDLPNPEIVDSPGWTLVALVDSFTMERRGEIPALFQRFATARAEIDNQITGAIYGLSLGSEPDGTFRYGVAVEVSEPGALPHEFKALKVPAATHAVFRLRTPIAEFATHFDAIFTDWLPNSGYTQQYGAIVERYPDHDNAPRDGAMLYEILVPVAKT